MCDCIHTTGRAKEEAVVFYRVIIFFQDLAEPRIKPFPFHYNDSMAVTVLSKAFSNNGIDKWKQCSKEAMKCCNNMRQEDLIPGIEFKIYFRM
jgi:hypothetical protein